MKTINYITIHELPTPLQFVANEIRNMTQEELHEGMVDKDISGLEYFEDTEKTQYRIDSYKEDNEDGRHTALINRLEALKHYIKNVAGENVLLLLSN
jgi:hypothetical protein